MNSLLVLYPIQPYADILMGGRELPKIKLEYARIYQRLIQKRYPGFCRIWVMFSQAQSPERPDMSQLWPGISIAEDDIILACGVDFAEHCKKKKYPDPENIIRMCPQPMEKLVIGGFHFWDCVKKTAKCAHEKGIDVLVDDDLTEFFFWKVRRKGIPSQRSIPLSLEKSLAKEKERLIKSGDYSQLEHVRVAREPYPWLAQM